MLKLQSLGFDKILTILDDELREIYARHSSRIEKVLSAVGPYIDNNEVFNAFLSLAQDYIMVAFLAGLEIGANPVRLFQKVQPGIAYITPGDNHRAPAFQLYLIAD